MTSRRLVLNLYHSLLDNAKRLDNYNFREHALRKIKWNFRKYKHVKHDEAIELYKVGNAELEVLKRQALISQLYPEEKSVMANIGPTINSIDRRLSS